MQAQTTQYALGTAALLEGPAAGKDSVVLGVAPPTGSWIAATEATWLHLSAANESGVGSANVVFGFDANPGETRSGTLTMGGLTVTITQAGSTYVAAGQQTTLPAAGLNGPGHLAVNSQGDIYIAAPFNNKIQEWSPGNGDLTTVVSSSNINQPFGVAVDLAGNIYIADSDNAIKKWTAANSNLTTLVSSGLDQPIGIALDGAGNIYIADMQDNAVKEWVIATSSLVTLVSGLNRPMDVAVDVAGNVYIADTENNAIKKWTLANSNVTALVSGLSSPYGVGVDGSGNVYFSDTGNKAIKKWTAANSNLTILSPLAATGVEVDDAGNVYFDNSIMPALYELPYVFVDAATKIEPSNAGTDALSPVLPATANLLAPFAPTSDQAWLAIAGITNGVVSIAYANNDTGTNRTAHITLFGQSISIIQSGPAMSGGGENTMGEPLLPSWGVAGLLAGVAAFGALFLHRRTTGAG